MKTVERENTTPPPSQAVEHRPPEDEEDRRWARGEPSVDEERRRLLERFGETLGDLDPRARDTVAWLATTMIDFLADARKSAPWRWSAGAASDYLEHFLRKQAAQDIRVIELVPEALRRWAAFWAAARRLDASSLAEVEVYVRRVARPFVRAALDRESWGVGTALHLRMIVDGIDPTDDRAVETWMARHHADGAGDFEAGV